MASLMELWMKTHNELIKEHRQVFEDVDELDLLKEKFAQYMKFLFGGQQYYIGRSLADVHRDLGITNA